MSLLRLLNLPVPKSLLMAQGPAESGSAQANGSAVVARPPTMGAPQGQAANGSGPGADAVHAEAAKMRGVIEAKRKEAQERLDKLEKLGPVLKQMSDAATGEKKKELAAKQAVLVKKTAETEREIKESIADLEAIDNPGSRREELVSIMARRGARTHIESDIEVDSPGLDPYKKSVNHDRTTTTTEYADGKATTEKVHDKQHVGIGGYNAEHSNEKVVQTKDSTARTSEEKKSHVSWTGKASVEEKKVSEVELADGRKSSAEHSTAKEISAKGAEKTETHKVTNFDGSSSEKTKKQGVERGEGQVTATTSTTVTQTSKSGTAHATEKEASGGIDVKDGAMGAHGGLDGGKTVTNKKGMQAGATLSVHANVTCKIGEPKGEPKRYPVTLTVSFGGSVGVSGGAGKKEGSKASASVEIKGSDEKSMTVTHMLTEEQLGTYIQALEAAAKGSKVAATESEFAIIAAGVKQGWGVAREMHKSGGDAVTKKATDTLVNPGDAIKVTDTKTGGVGVKGEGKGIGIGYGVTDTDTKTLEVKRNEKGGIDAETESEHGRTKNKSGSMALLGMGVSVGKTTTHKTSFGYSITIDPKDDPDGKILEALGMCESQMQYALFMGLYKGRITVTGKTEGKSDAESLDTGVSVAGVTVFSMGEGHGVDEKTKTDAKGKVVSKTVAAHANIGAKLGGWADSKNDDAVAEIDGEGHGKLKLSSTDNDNHNSRSRDKHDKKAQEKLAGKGKQTGALTDLAGGEEEDLATHDVSGLTLSNADLKKIGGVACRSLPAWVGLHRRADEIEDLRKAGIEIAKAKGAPGVVAEQLTRFIGGDSVERLETVRRIARGGYHATTGSAFEFPDSIRGLQEDYETVIDDGLVKKINEIGRKSQVKAKEECQRLLKMCDTLMSEIGACKDFRNTATRAEMVQKLELVRQNLAVSVKGFAGEKPAVDMKQLVEDGKRLAKQCSAFYSDHMKLSVELYDLKGDDKMIPNSDRGDARKLIKKLEDLIYRWRGQWYLLKDNYKAQGLPEAMLMIPTILPNEKVVDFWDKACGN